MDKMKIIFIALSIIICILVYAPTPKGIDPEQFNPKQPINVDSLQVSKNQLADAVYITMPAPGAQDVQIDKQGYIYSGLNDGSIVQISPDHSQTKIIAKSQGPIFGIDLNSKGDKLAFADQFAGIKILDINEGNMQYVVGQDNGNIFASPNSVVFGQNDQILYFSVSSSVIKMSEFHEMLLYSEGSGRIYSYNLKNKKLQVLADHLHFVNGLEYSSKQNCLYFIQTSRSKLTRMELKPEKRGNVTVIVDNILGYPDNVKLASDGNLWIALPALRDSFSNIIDHNSLFRRVLINLRVPLGMFLALANMKYAGGIKIDPKAKQIKQYFFGNSDKISCISGINQGNGKLYLSSLCQDKIAVVDIPYQYSREQEQQIIHVKPQTKKINLTSKQQIKQAQIILEQTKQTKTPTPQIPNNKAQNELITQIKAQKQSQVPIQKKTQQKLKQNKQQPIQQQIITSKSTEQKKNTIEPSIANEIIKQQVNVVQESVKATINEKKSEQKINKEQIIQQSTVVINRQVTEQSQTASPKQQKATIIQQKPIPKIKLAQAKQTTAPKANQQKHNKQTTQAQSNTKGNNKNTSNSGSAKTQGASKPSGQQKQQNQQQKTNAGNTKTQGTTKQTQQNQNKQQQQTKQTNSGSQGHHSHANTHGRNNYGTKGHKQQGRGYNSYRNEL